VGRSGSSGVTSRNIFCRTLGSIGLRLYPAYGLELLSTLCACPFGNTIIVVYDRFHIVTGRERFPAIVARLPHYAQSLRP
jgi:hypothetical protein